MECGRLGSVRKCGELLKKARYPIPNFKHSHTMATAISGSFKRAAPLQLLVHGKPAGVMGTVAATKRRIVLEALCLDACSDAKFSFPSNSTLAD